MLFLTQNCLPACLMGIVMSTQGGSVFVTPGRMTVPGEAISTGWRRPTMIQVPLHLHYTCISLALHSHYTRIVLTLHSHNTRITPT